MGKFNDWWNNKVEGNIRNWLDDHKVINALTKPLQWAYNAVDIPHEALIDTIDGVKGVIKGTLDDKSSASGNVTTTPTTPTGGTGSMSVQGSTQNPIQDAMNNVQNIINGQIDTSGGVFNDLLGLTHAVGMNNQYDLAKWQLENAYNSPSAQMQRLKDAGLNPNLMYGNGSTASTGNADPIGSSHIQGGLGATQALQMVTGMSQFGKTMTEVSNIEANTRKTLAETEMLGYTIEQEKVGVSIAVENLKKLKAEVSKIESETRLNELEQIYKQYVNDNIPLEVLQRQYNLTKTEEEILKIRADTQNTIAGTSALNQNTNIQAWTFNHIDRPLKLAELADRQLESQLYHIYGERDAAMKGTSGLVGNIMSIGGGLVSEIKQGIRKRRGTEYKPKK